MLRNLTARLSTDKTKPFSIHCFQTETYREKEEEEEVTVLVIKIEEDLFDL